MAWEWVKPLARAEVCVWRGVLLKPRAHGAVMCGRASAAGGACGAMQRLSWRGCRLDGAGARWAEAGAGTGTKAVQKWAGGPGDLLLSDHAYLALKPSWKRLNFSTNSAIFSSRGRIVVRRWKVPSSCPKPLPGIVTMPLSSSRRRQ